MADIATILKDGQDVSMPALRNYLAEQASRIDQLGTTISAGVLGFDGFATVDDMNAAPGEVDGQLAYVFANSGYDSADSPVEDPLNQPYQWNASVNEWVAAPWLFGVLATLVQSLVDDAEAAADAAQAASDMLRTNLWPDTFFKASGGNMIYAAGGHYVYSMNYQNRFWKADYSHIYGRGAWEYNSSYSQAIQGYPVWFDFNQPGDPALVPGDKVSAAVIVEAADGTVSIAARFFGSGGPIDFIGDQITGTAAAAMDGTPKVLKVEDMTVPADAVGVHVYVFDAAASTFYTLAMWALPGVVAGDVPPPNVARAEGSALALTGDGRADFAVERAPTWAGMTPVLTAASPGQTVRTANFTGFGNIFTPAGSPWNAIRIRELQQTASAVPWEEIHVVVRIGASGGADDRAATIVAHGSVAVDPEETTLVDTIVPLRDPKTGDLLADVEELLVDAEYGVMVYARTAKGVNASMNQPNGTLSNRVASRAYYVTTLDAASSEWLPLSPDSGIALEHVLLSGVAEGFAPSIPFRKAMASDGPAAAGIVALPPVLYGGTGRQMNAYFDNMVYGSGDDYFWDITTTARGSQQEERWTWDITSAVDEAIGFGLYDKAGYQEIDSKTADLKVATLPPASPRSWTVLVVGDSLVASGEITAELLDLAAAGGSNTTIALIGTRGAGSNKYEGRGGYTVEDFSTAGRIFQSFTVSGVTVPPAINSTEVVYTHNGRTYTPQDVNLSDGDGTIVCSYTGGSAPDASGTLTKVGSGPGDETIAFSSTATASGNPFWNDGALDVGEYLSDNSFATPDYVVIALGINDVAALASDAAVDGKIVTAFAQLETLIAAFTDADPGINVVLAIPAPPSAYQSAAGSNYGTGINRGRYKRNIVRWAGALIEQFRGREAERIYLAPTNVAVDTVHGYPSIMVAANSRTSDTVPRGTNLVHPSTSGYEQIADVLWAMLHVLGA